MGHSNLVAKKEEQQPKNTGITPDYRRYSEGRNINDISLSEPSQGTAHEEKHPGMLQLNCGEHFKFNCFVFHPLHMTLTEI